MALSEREMRLGEFQISISSTILQRQSYDFHRVSHAPNQFPKSENQYPHSPSQFLYQEDEESILEKSMEYNLDEKVQNDFLYYIRKKNKCPMKNVYLLIIISESTKIILF